MLFIKSVSSLKPMFDRVLVQRFKPSTQTASGLYIPEAATNTKWYKAEVISVGPGFPNPQTGELVPVSVKPGDQVMLTGFGGSPIKVEDQEYYLIRDTEIVAKLE